MKFTTLAMIGLASAVEEIKFMQEPVLEDETELLTLGSGACINWSFSRNKFYDLKPFDTENRDEAKELPAKLPFPSAQFLYKACQPFWKMTADTYNVAPPNAKPYAEGLWKDTEKSTAYWVVDGKPEYTFMNAEIESLKSPNEEASETAQENAEDGFTITWTSQEECANNKNKNFVVELTAVCDPAVAAGVFSDEKEGEDKCTASVQYKGANACGKPIPLVEAFMKLAPFFGAILIVFGGIIAFFGSKFLFVVFGGIVGFVAATLFFLLAYSLFLPIEAETGMVAGVIVGCVVLGGLLAYFSYKLTRAFVVPILGAVGGVVIFLMLVKAFKLKKRTWNLVFAILGGVVGWFLAYKFRSFIRAAGTALIGSFLLVRGVGCYAPGYPNELNINAKQLVKNPNANLELLAYLAGFVVVAIVGTIFQVKTQAVDEENEDDEFKNQDESKTCGCF